MPPSAAATLPSVGRTAVEWAPLTAPNSSLSMSSAGKAPQFTSMKGRPARGLLS